MRVIESDDFESLKENWNSLLERNLLGANVFSTWEWLSTWWKHFGHGRRLSLLTVEDGGKTIAIAPLMRTIYKLPAFGKIEKIEFVGAKQSDYNTLIILNQQMECFKLITDYLLETSVDWDWIDLIDIPESMTSSQLFSSGIPVNLNLKTRFCNVCPYISLPNSFESLMNGFSSNMRQDLRKKLRKFQRNYNIKLKKFDETDLSIKESMDVFIGLHQKKWEIAGFSGTFYDQAIRDFHMDVAETFANNGWLSLYFLMANDEPIAGHYSFDYAQKIYYYLSGFLPQYSSYSPGSLIILLVLQRCIAEGFVEYDLMRGEDDYKTRWTNSFRKNLEVRLVRKNCHSKFFDWITWNHVFEKMARRLNFSLTVE